MDLHSPAPSLNIHNHDASMDTTHHKYHWRLIVTIGLMVLLIVAAVLVWLLYFRVNFSNQVAFSIKVGTGKPTVTQYLNNVNAEAYVNTTKSTFVLKPTSGKSGPIQLGDRFTIYDPRTKTYLQKPPTTAPYQLTFGAVADQFYFSHCVQGKGCVEKPVSPIYVTKQYSIVNSKGHPLNVASNLGVVSSNVTDMTNFVWTIRK